MLDSYPIVYINKIFKQHPLCVYCSLDSVLLLRSFQSLAERTNRVFCSVTKYITDCYLITYYTNNSFLYLVGDLPLQLLKSPISTALREANPIRSIPFHDGVPDKMHMKPLNALFITDIPERTKPHRTP